MAPHARLGTAPTELSMPAVALDAPILAVAQAVHDGSDEAVVLIEPGGHVHVLSAGSPLVERLGHSLEDLLDDPTSFVRDNDEFRLIAAYHTVAAEPDARSTLRFSVRDHTGGFVELEARLLNAAAESPGAVVVHLRRTVSETETPMVRLSNLPQLERVADRETFITHAQGVIDRKVSKVWDAPAHARAVMRDRRWDYALILIYLDRFNILLGGFGAETLTDICVEACKRLRKVLRSADAVAPVGATEIAVLLEGVNDVDHIARLTDLALDTLRPPIPTADVPVALVPIAGIASSTRRYNDTSNLLQDAAAAAGRALLGGHADHETFQTEFRTETVQRMSLMADLKEGIGRGELFLLYQPLYSLTDGTCKALEAFVRWRHPKLGLIMPGDFIPMAEETGLIRPLTEWVLRAGCVAMSDIAEERALRLHVNVGAAELSDRAFLDSVDEALEAAKLSAGWLCLDMSESALVDGSDTARNTMLRLSTKGVRFALDDYGTGASSLRYLADLPFDFVKIDTSISQQVDDTQRRVARAMIALAHELGRQVIAEGVESEAQKESLAALGSDEAQGYFFSKPMKLDALQRVIWS